MELEYTLSAQDNIEATRLLTRLILGRFKFWFIAIWMHVLLVFSLWTVFVTRYYSFVGVFTAVITSCMATAWYLVLPLYLKRDHRRKLSHEHIKVTLGETTYKVSGSGGQSEIEWKTYNKWREGKSVFLVARKNGNCAIFPKRAFLSREDMERFRKILTSQLGK